MTPSPQSDTIDSLVQYWFNRERVETIRRLIPMRFTSLELQEAEELDTGDFLDDELEPEPINEEYLFWLWWRLNEDPLLVYSNTNDNSPFIWVEQANPLRFHPVVLTNGMLPRCPRNTDICAILDVLTFAKVKMEDRIPVFHNYLCCYFCSVNARADPPLLVGCTKGGLLRAMGLSRGGITVHATQKSVYSLPNLVPFTPGPTQDITGTVSCTWRSEDVPSLSQYDLYAAPPLTSDAPGNNAFVFPVDLETAEPLVAEELVELIGDEGLQVVGPMGETPQHHEPVQFRVDSHDPIAQQSQVAEDNNFALEFSPEPEQPYDDFVAVASQTDAAQRPMLPTNQCGVIQSVQQQPIYEGGAHELMEGPTIHEKENSLFNQQQPPAVPAESAEHDLWNFNGQLQEWHNSGISAAPRSSFPALRSAFILQEHSMPGSPSTDTVNHQLPRNVQLGFTPTMVEPSETVSTMIPFVQQSPASFKPSWDYKGKGKAREHTDILDESAGNFDLPHVVPERTVSTPVNLDIDVADCPPSTVQLVLAPMMAQGPSEATMPKKRKRGNTSETEADAPGPSQPPKRTAINRSRIQSQPEATQIFLLDPPPSFFDGVVMVGDDGKPIFFTTPAQAFNPSSQSVLNFETA